ncbi:MAG: 6-bladed beta-propeller, partial [Bacteroidales bacterium]|nr:6-bladed beta-propeller [Bacteroidales bacterium]
MRKVFLLIPTLFILLCVWNCGNKNEQRARTSFHADLDNCKLSTDLKLSDLIEDYRLVPLETTNESLLGEFRNIINLSGEYILIADRNNVYKFSGDGRFINTILKNGRGPGETSGSCRYFFNRSSNILFFIDDFVENENIRCYDVKAEK